MGTNDKEVALCAKQELAVIIVLWKMSYEESDMRA
jgi:hypothetical protein